MEKNKMLKLNNIIYFLLFLYIIAMTTYQLGKGFDAIFVRVSFATWVVLTILLKKKIEINSLLKWGILFWGFYFLSLIWAYNKNDTLFMINHFIEIMGMLICFPLIVKDKKDIKIILNLIIISLLYSTIILVIRTPQTAWGSDSIGEVIGLQRNAIGFRLAIGFLICVYFIHLNIENKKRLTFKIIILIIMALFFASIALLTGSKKALLCLVVGFVVFELAKSKGIFFVFKIAGIVLIGMIIVRFIFYNPILYDALGSRVEHLVLTLQGKAGRGEVDGSLLERQFFIKEAKYLFKSNPIIGYGGNNFVSYMRKIQYNHVAYSHNNFWELLSTLGVIGFSIYYFIWGKLLVDLFRNYRQTKSNETLLFLILITINIILDYGNVSYSSEFYMLMLSCSYVYMNKCIKKNN